MSFDNATRCQGTCRLSYERGGELVLSKTKLILEVTRKQSVHHSRIAKEIKSTLDNGNTTKVAAKLLMRKLICKYKWGQFLNTSHCMDSKPNRLTVSFEPARLTVSLGRITYTNSRNRLVGSFWIIVSYSISRPYVV